MPLTKYEGLSYPIPVLEIGDSGIRNDFIEY